MCPSCLVTHIPAQAELRHLVHLLYPLTDLFMPGRWQCPHPSCGFLGRSPGGLTQHLNAKHKHDKKFGKRDKTLHREYYPIIDGRSKLFCSFGVFTQTFEQTPHAIRTAMILKMEPHLPLSQQVVHQPGHHLTHRLNLRPLSSCSRRLRCPREKSIPLCSCGHPQQQIIVHLLRATRTCLLLSMRSKMVTPHGRASRRSTLVPARLGTLQTGWSSSTLSTTVTRSLCCDRSSRIQASRGSSTMLPTRSLKMVFGGGLM